MAEPAEPSKRSAVDGAAGPEGLGERPEAMRPADTAAAEPAEPAAVAEPGEAGQAAQGTVMVNGVEIHDPELAAALAAFEASLPKPDRPSPPTTSPSDAPTTDEPTDPEPQLAAAAVGAPVAPGEPVSVEDPAVRPTAASESKTPGPEQTDQGERAEQADRPDRPETDTDPEPTEVAPVEAAAPVEQTRPDPAWGRASAAPAIPGRTGTAEPPVARPDGIRMHPAALWSAPPGSTAPAAPTTAPPRADEVGAERTPHRARRSLVAVVMILLAGLAAVLLPRILDDSRTGTPPASNPVPAPPTDRGAAAGGTVPQPGTSSPEPAALPPAGFRLHRDPTGFSIAVPTGWRAVRDGNLVDFRDPDSNRFLRIDQRTNPRGDPYDDWISQQPEVAKQLAGYDLKRIARVQYRGWPTADWEFTWGARTAQLHVLNRNVVPSRLRAYALYWSTSDSRWVADRELFDVIASTFSPAAR